MAAKPNIPVSRKEMYLDVMTGGSSSLPEPITLEEMYLAKIAGMAVDLPTPRYIKHKYLAKIAGMTVNVPTYTMNLPRIYAYLAKAAGQDVEIPQPVTREEMYWFDYCGGTPTPPEREYTGAVPVTFIANGQPLLDYLISGNEEHSGTPTPDSPITPEGTGERTENLFDEVYSDISVIIRYRPMFVGDGTFTLSTTTPYDNSVANVFLLSGNVSSGASTSGNGAWLKHKVTTQSIDGYVTIAYRRYSGTTSPVDCQTMLNTGSTALPYEPYGIKIPISSAGQTTSIYLGEVETTRLVKKLVLTGEESDWGTSGDGAAQIFNHTIGLYADLQPYAICNMFHQSNNAASYNNSFDIVRSSGNGVIRFNNSGIASTTAAWKSYLAQQYAAGTPVTVWYVLGTPETGIVNEPLMRIGDYADTLSMEQAGAQIPTANGSNTLDVLTTVKPSEVYIKYKGEPVAGSQTSSQSSAYAPAEVSSQSENVDDINNSLLGKEEETE